MTFGVDFGTTNSAVVYEQTEHVGGMTVPTAIAFNPVTGNIEYGQEVRRRHGELLAARWLVVTSVKSCLDDPTRQWKIAGRTETPRSVTTYFFEHLIDYVKEHRQVSMDRAVVSIPVGFSPLKRQVLRAAAADAGVEVTEFVSESTAAVMHAMTRLGGMTSIAVFDWGGGTLDISVLQLTGTQIRERAIQGMPVAGDRMDLLIAEWSYAEMRPQLPPTAPESFDQVPPRERDEWLVICEQGKQALSDETKHLLTIGEFLGTSFPSVTLTRERLRTLIQEILRSAFATLERTLASVGLDADRIDAILPIGGTCNLVAVREELEERYGPKVIELKDPEWVVAEGASVLADRITSGPARTVARLDQRVALALEDGTYMPLVGEGDAFGAAPITHHLGIVEDTKSAQLVFAEPVDGRHSTIGYLTAPMQGFVQERLELHSRLTDDLTFVAEAMSQNGNQDDLRKFEYDRLRFLYDLGSTGPAGLAGLEPTDADAI